MSSHPINQANEMSPYGELKREDFYKKHKINHQEGFVKNKRDMRIFTQSWSAADDHDQSRGLIAMIHGYNSESSWLFELTAVYFAKSGFHVVSLDLPGHGHSDGRPGHLPSVQPVIGDCIQVFDAARAGHERLPAFLYGESLGGAIAMLIALRQRNQWAGLVLNGAMCGVSKKFKPVWPLESLLPVAAFVAPSWRIVITPPPASKSFKVRWKNKLVMRSPKSQARMRPPAATALEFLRLCNELKETSRELELPLLILHGEKDVICDPESARSVYESAASKDKALKIFPGMWHQLIGEPNESVDHVFGIILSWIGDRADRFGLRKKDLEVSVP